ncbi:MAG: hypothetical protein ACUVS9_04285 [Thermaceae bacterium]
MRLFLILLFQTLALAQTLLLPREAKVGQEVLLEGQGLPEGEYPLVVEGPKGLETTVQVQEGGFRLPFTPEEAGEYRVRLLLPTGLLEGSFTAQADSPSPEPQLTEEGLVYGELRLPLPQAEWKGPVKWGDKLLLAAESLVLEVLPTGEVRYHFAPGPVRALRPGEVVVEGERVLPLPFPFLPFEGSEEDLKALRPLLQALTPPKPWPYWAYWTLDPLTLTEEDLKAYGEDLYRRGHRPELFYSQKPILDWKEAALAHLKENPEAAARLIQALLRYTPLFPGSLAFFEEAAQALEAQGQTDLALSIRERLEVVKTWGLPDLEGLSFWIKVLLLGYGILFLYLFLGYFPSQRRNLAPIGGFLFGFFRHPLLRLRHLHLAYASFGERLLVLILFLLASGSLLLYGLDAKTRPLLTQGPLAQGTLRSEAAKDWLSTSPKTPFTEALLGYSLLSENPKEAFRLLQEAPPFPFVLALRGDLNEAYDRAPLMGPVRSSLGLGTDAWGGREAAPSQRTLYGILLLAELSKLKEDFLRNVLDLPLPFQLSPTLRGSLWVLAFLLLVYHLLAFFLPRPRGVTPPPLFLRVLVPGSLAFASGYGVVLLLLAAYGVLVPPWPLALAYLLHLPGLLQSWRRK